MGLLGKGAVKPVDDDEDFDPTADDRKGGFAGWVKKHPVVTSVVATLLILGLVAAIVVPVTCAVHGCPPKQAESEVNEMYRGAPLRLVVSFLSSIDVQDIVPPILQMYTARVQLALSNLQVLEAVDEDVLEIVLSEIRKRTDLEFVVRDFVLRSPSIIDPSGNIGRRMQQTYNLTDPGMSSTWWFNAINVTGAWRLLNVNAANPSNRTSDVIVAVTDSGAFVTHPDLANTWWNNPAEVDNDMTDNDNNTFIDDFYGACFATRKCSPTYSNNNISWCGIGRNTSAWNGIVDVTSHGTKIAGVIGATPSNGIGFAGVAPNLRQMILKVTDEDADSVNPPYAYSDVVRAVDYGYGKGARIFSMSFGNNGRTGATAANKPALDAAANAYKTLFTKYNNALFVAAAGNEWSNLDNWSKGNYTYSPCMVNTDNTLCVGGTNSNDGMFYFQVNGQDQGTNFGAATVDVGAPGASIYTTDLDRNGLYNSVHGTSFSTPITAAVAGLVLAALGGQSRATAQTPLQIKNILMSTGDLLPALQGQFKSSRRINAGNAVAAAMTLASTNRTTLRRTRTFAEVNTSVALQGVEYYWYSGIYTDGAFDLSSGNFYFLDYYVRNQVNTNFNIWRYGPNTLVMATAMMRIDTPGMYSVQARTTAADFSKWQLTIGENVVLWKVVNSTYGTADLLFPDAGWYNLTLWAYPDWSTLINFQWQVPGSNSFTAFNSMWTLDEAAPSSRFYDPNPAAKPALWHVVWNETAVFDDFTNNRGYFVMNQEPRLYRMRQTTVADFSFATGKDLRTGLYGIGGSLTSGNNVVYGYARTNLRAQAFSTAISFRLQGPHTRLFINGQNIFDFQSDAQLQTVTPCVTLRNNTAHEIFFYFAAMPNSSNPVGITWATCTGNNAPGGNSGSYTSMSGSLAANFFFNPANPGSLQKGFRCDAWPANTTINTVGTTPPVGTPSRLSWMYPRDCHPNNKVGTECRMATIMRDLFPNVTWNVWNVRCFTYWSGSLTNGTSRALNLIGPAFQHMAGVRTYEQWADGVSFTNYAPMNTRFASNVYQLYVLEWVAYGNMWNRVAQQAIWDGTTDITSANYLTTNSATMLVPLASNIAFTWADWP